MCLSKRSRAGPSSQSTDSKRLAVGVAVPERGEQQPPSAASQMDRLVKEKITTTTTTERTFALQTESRQPDAPRPPPKRKPSALPQPSKKQKQEDASLLSGESAGETTRVEREASCTPAERRTGRPFERHTKRVLREVAAGRTAVGGGALAEALAEKQVYAWHEVPAELLVEMEWEPRGEAERRRIYDTPRRERGFVGEYGVDWVADGERDGVRHIVYGQDKDHKLLCLSALGRFNGIAIRAHKSNVKRGLPTGVTSSVLCYPEETHISRRDLSLLSDYAEFGMLRVAFTGFAPLQARDPEACDVREDEEFVAARPDVVAPATTRTVASTEEDYSAALPNGARPRPFQAKTVTRIMASPGLHLVQAPPGCGKTAIAAKVVDRLVVPEHATRKGKGRDGLVIAFATAPLIDHVNQLLDNMQKVLLKQLGSGWRAFVQGVFDDDVPSVQTLLHSLDTGVRLFASTDKSAHLLLDVAKEAKSRGNRILVIKDEAHYNSYHSSASTQLLALADPAAGDVAVACTATPDADVMCMPGLQRTLQLPLDEAIRLGHCRPYRVVLPSITGVADGLPVEARDIANAHRLGTAALFLVGGMLRDGKRRAIAYAQNAKEAEASGDLIRQACEFHGVDYSFDVILERTLDRNTKYKKFCTAPVWQPAELDGESGHRVTLRFLISVRILDMCVDLPETDSVCLLSPPASQGDVKSAHRAIQQLGRATRGKYGGVAFMYIFTDLSNPWLSHFFRVLLEFDPGCIRRLSVRSTCPISQYTQAAQLQCESDLKEVIKRYNIDGSSSRYADDQMTELARL
eukprot:7379553-Prymnesium_polylepis.1